MLLIDLRIKKYNREIPFFITYDRLLSYTIFTFYYLSLRSSDNIRMYIPENLR